MNNKPSAARAKAQKLLDAALAHAAAGRPVFPCGNNKRPYIKGGFHVATTDPAQIEKWWWEWPEALIGMPTGKVSGFDVLDLDKKADRDPPKDGYAHVPNWEKLTPVIAITGTGGAHLYFQYSGVKCSSDKIAYGVDTRGDGGYVIVPPSPGYRWKNSSDFTALPPYPPDLRPPDDDPPPLPEWLAALASGGRGISTDPDDLLPPPDPARVAAALEVIPNPNFGWDDWSRIGMATFAATGGSADGFAAFDAWSRKSTKYDSKNTDERWEHWKKHPPTRLSAGTIFYEASQADPDWDVKEEDTAPPPPPSSIALCWHGEHREVELRWRVKNRVPERGAGLISGQWGTGKTFVGLNLAWALGGQTHWTGQRIVENCGVLWIAAEAPWQIPLRLRGIVDDDTKLPFVWSKTCPRLLTPRGRMSDKGVAELIAVAKAATEGMKQRHNKPLGVMIIDTVARAASFGNENDPAECQAVMDALGTISNESGTFVFGLDHYGKDETKGTRGGSPKEDYSEAVLALYGRSGERKMVIRKLRDGPVGMEIPFSLPVVELGRDKDGEPVTTARVEWAEARAAAAAVKLKKGPGLLQEVITAAGGLPAPISTIRDAFYARYEADKPTAKRTAFNRALKGLGITGAVVDGAEVYQWADEPI